MTGKTIVVNVREPFDVYIGRAGRGESGRFGNPFRVGPGMSRERAIASYKTYFFARVAGDPAFREAVMDLRAKRLGCFCRPALPCHGDVIAEWLDSQA